MWLSGEVGSEHCEAGRALFFLWAPRRGHFGPRFRVYFGFCIFLILNLIFTVILSIKIHKRGVVHVDLHLAYTWQRGVLC